MAILKISEYPEPVLRKPASLIKKIDARVNGLARDMTETMYAAPKTIGLAAPQVGESRQLIVLDVSAREKKHGLLILLNPRIISMEEPLSLREGCLSVPEYTGNVMRYNQITVEALNLAGETISIVTSGIEAICLQHEIDHVQGKLFIDRVNSLKTDIFRRKAFSSWKK